MRTGRQRTLEACDPRKPDAGSVRSPGRSIYGLAALKLSKTAAPGALASGCQVPAFISNIVPASVIELFQASLNIVLHAPGTPPLSGAVSNTALPVVPSCRILKNF